MFRRAIEAVKNGEKPPSIDSGFGRIEKAKPFKIPFAAKPIKGLGRRRKRVDYAAMGGGDDDGGSDAEIGNDSDGENKRPKKKAKKGKAITFENFKGVDANGASLKADNRVWEYYKPKEGAIKRQFAIPKMTLKGGQIVQSRLSNTALGTRQAIEIPPRPLHDPMAELAIVLFDPTIDDVEAEREKARIQEIQAATEEIMSSQDKSNVVVEVKPVDRGPHKSLAEILKIKSKKDKIKIEEKVAVVIDPVLAKVLRPHQVEGVKVSDVFRRIKESLAKHEVLTLSHLLSFCIVVPLA